MACPLAPPGVTPSMSEDFQALMRQGDRSDPLGERTWKTDFAPDVEDANNCLDARPDDLICIQGGVDAPFDAPLIFCIDKLEAYFETFREKTSHSPFPTATLKRLPSHHKFQSRTIGRRTPAVSLARSSHRSQES